MAPMPGAIWGTSAPTAKQSRRDRDTRDITGSTGRGAMIDHGHLNFLGSALSAPPRSPACPLELAAAAFGGDRLFEARRETAPSGPIRGPTSNICPRSFQRIDGRLWHAVLDHEHAGPRGAWPERNREMFRMPPPGASIAFLQVELGMDMPQEKLRGPIGPADRRGRAPC